MSLDETASLPMISRRRVLAGVAAGALVSAVGLPARADMREFHLKVAPGKARLAPVPYPDTAVWAYNGSVPGPEIRVRQGERLRIVVDNALAEATTVHCHGIRLPNAMDGVPHLTSGRSGRARPSSTSSTRSTPGPSGTTRTNAAPSRSTAGCRVRW